MERKRTSLTIERKIDILDKLNAMRGTTPNLAEQYQISLETILRIQREENKLRSYAAKEIRELKFKERKQDIQFLRIWKTTLSFWGSGQ